MTPSEIQDKLAKLQNMELNYDRYQADSLVLDKTYKKLLELIPVPVMVAYLMKKKKIKRMWMAI